MKVLCNKTTKKIEGFSRRDDFDFNPSTHVVIDIYEMPDLELDRLNDTNDGIRNPTQAELDDLAAIKNNAVIDKELKEIDLASIRSLREYIAAQSDAPQFIKDHEIEAAAKRSERL